MNKKGDIIFLLHLPPPVHGSSLVGQFIKNSKLINKSFDGRYINLLMSRNVNESGSISIMKIFRSVKVWFILLSKLISKRSDLCYFALTTTGAAFYRDFLLVVLLRIFGVKTIFHLHNKGVKNKSKNKINRIIYKFVFNDSNIILLSMKLYSDIELYVPQSRVYICPNGIENNFLIKTSRLDPTQKPVKILFLSNLIETKGVYDLINACALLNEKGLRYECDFIGGLGDINYEQFNNQIIKNKLTDKVKYLGVKYNEGKEVAFQQADIFVLPTYYSNECFPLVILEAMKFGLPVISTYEGGIPDIVEDGVTGYLVAQKDVNELAEKIQLLIEDSLLRDRMGKAGQLKYETQYTLNIFEKRMKDILAENLISQVKYIKN